jgi:dihydrofolate reductase
MAKLIYSAFTSLDGYVADASGNFEWTELDDEVHAYINDRERQNGTYLFGRKMYETMAVWDKPDALPPLPPAALAFLPIWQAAEKIVYSTTLQTVAMANARLERKFDADVVKQLKAGAARNLSVGGPGLAAHAIRAGLVDEYHLLIAPVIAGGGNPCLPDNVRVKLELLDERRFDHGIVHVRYQAKR